MKNDELEALDARVNAMLPPVYRGCYTRVSPSSMGSAEVKYGPDGKPAWGDIWTTYCDLALAGGPPHRGTLLEPVPAASVDAEPERSREVLAEIHRAVRLTADLPPADAPPGWVGVACPTEAMAAWVQFAVVAENVSCRRRGAVLHLPAGPAFRVGKEVKNVTVALAKACHYWEGHLTAGQQGAAAALTPWEPAGPAQAAVSPAAYREAFDAAAQALRDASGLSVTDRYAGWAGVEAGGEDAAVWLLRAVVASGVLCRREGGTLFLPVGASTEADGAARAAPVFAQAWRLWGAHRAG